MKQFKVDDKFIVSSIPISASLYTREASGKSGTIISKCSVVGCFIVRLSDGSQRHMCEDWLYPIATTVTKNQQLLFSFMEK